MPKFMGIHTLPPGGFTAEQVRQLAQAAQHGHEGPETLLPRPRG